MALTKRALFLFPTDKMGGAERVTLAVADACLSSGDFNEITCFVLTSPRSRTLNAIATDPRVRLIYTGARSEKGGLMQLLRVLAKTDYQLVFSSHTHLNAAASLMRGLGVLRTERLVTRESTMIFERELGWRTQLIRRLYLLYGKQDLIVCQTERMAASLTLHTGGRFAARTITIPNPIDLHGVAAARSVLSNELAAIPATARKIVWCGRLSPVKSPLRAVDALAALHRLGYVDSHLVMIGDGPMRAEILTHANSLGLADHITLTGHHLAPAALMQHCQAGLMTSDIEGFPNVILEMLAAGLPAVVSTDCAGGLTEIPGVHVTQTGTPETLAATLAAVLSQHESNHQLVEFFAQRSPATFYKKLMNA
jgi:glycosyltransferase involved in cell wall biosynthesis